MSEPFTDIRITGLDVSATKQSPNAPGLRLMHLSLSGTPPSVWAHIFQAEREFPRHTMWRRAWIQGSSIVVDCVPEELEKYHLHDLKEDVDNSNAKFKNYLVQEENKAKAAQEEERREREFLEQVKNRLKFD